MRVNARIFYGEYERSSGLECIQRSNDSLDNHSVVSLGLSGKLQVVIVEKGELALVLFRMKVIAYWPTGSVTVNE